MYFDGFGYFPSSKILRRLIRMGGGKILNHIKIFQNILKSLGGFRDCFQCPLLFIFLLPYCVDILRSSWDRGPFEEFNFMFLVGLL
jgi:hypothetical protein